MLIFFQTIFAFTQTITMFRYYSGIVIPRHSCCFSTLLCCWYCVFDDTSICIRPSCYPNELKDLFAAIHFGFLPLQTSFPFQHLQTYEKESEKVAASRFCKERRCYQSNEKSTWRVDCDKILESLATGTPTNAIRYLTKTGSCSKASFSR
ncbi:MAG: hypothetical protein ACI8RD_004732, partial [Bacillariaceae sp.]